MEIFKKVKKIISKKFFDKVIILFFLMLISVILETLGIALIFPVLSFLAEANFVSQFKVVNSVTEYLQSNFGKKEIVTFSILALLLVYFLKNLFLFIFTWWKGSFSDKLYRDICERLLKKYMSLSYLEYIKKNSAVLARNFVEVKGFSKFIDNLIIFLIEVLVLVSITALLLTVEPFATIVVVLFIGFISLIFRKFTKKYIDFWGKKRLEHSGIALKNLLQAINSFKIIKVLGREKNFISKYTDVNFRYSTVKKLFDILDNTPRFWLEFVGVLGLCIFTYILLLKNDEVINIIPILGLFSASAFRLLPAVTRIIRSYQSLNFTIPIVNVLSQELGDDIEIKKQSNEPAIIFNNNLNLNNIFFKYLEQKDYILKNLSLEIKKGEVVGIMGTTGTGKSTLIDILIGIIKPDKGNITVDGQSINNNYRSWQDLIGYVPQATMMMDNSIKNNIIFGLEKNIKKNHIDELIKIVQLENFIKELPLGLDTIVGDRGVRLSGGQQQRIGIARALLHKPNFIIFDEATSALDSETEKKLMHEIKNYIKNRSLLIISHRKSTLEHCNKVYVLRNQDLHLQNNIKINGE